MIIDEAYVAYRKQRLNIRKYMARSTVTDVPLVDQIIFASAFKKRNFYRYVLLSD